MLAHKSQVGSLHDAGKKALEPANSKRVLGVRSGESTRGLPEPETKLVVNGVPADHCEAMSGAARCWGASIRTGDERHDEQADNQNNLADGE